MTASATTNRSNIQALKDRPQADVLIIGGGINGIATFRDLALQGVDVALVERGVDGKAVVSVEAAEQMAVHRQAEPPYDVDAAMKAAEKARAESAPYMRQLRTSAGLRSLSVSAVAAQPKAAGKSAPPAFRQYREKDGLFYFKLATPGGAALLQSRGYANPREAAAAIALCKEQGVEAVTVQADVSTAEGCKKLFEEAVNAFGRVDILVNNAGITRDGLMLRMKDEDFDAVLDTNLKGAFNMIRACYSGFIRKKSGRIINISSVSGIMGNAGQANYSASKAGVIGLTKSVARELASRGITCNAVAPGFIQTDMTENLGDNNPLLNSIPLGRMGKPEDIAAAVAFLASDSAAYITGEVLKVDGGLAI